MQDVLFLDAQTKDEENRLTAFGTKITDLVLDYQEWASERELSQQDMWYADIFKHIAEHKSEHIACLVIESDGVIVAEAPEKQVKNPYRRRKSILERLKML